MDDGITTLDQTLRSTDLLYLSFAQDNILVPILDLTGGAAIENILERISVVEHHCDDPQPEIRPQNLHG